MKARKMVHGSYARTILSEQEASRLRAQGWLEVTDSKAVTKGASWQRTYRQRQQESGKRELLVWINDEAYRFLESRKQGKDSLATVIERLVKMLKLIE